MLQIINHRHANFAVVVMAISQYKSKPARFTFTYNTRATDICIQKRKKTLDSCKPVRNRDYEVADSILSSTHTFFFLIVCATSFLLCQ